MSKALCILIALIVIIFWITPQMRIWLGVEAPVPASPGSQCHCGAPLTAPPDQVRCQAPCGSTTLLGDHPPIKLLVYEPVYTGVYSKDCGYQAQFSGMRTYEVTAYFDAARNAYWYIDRFGVEHIYAQR